MSRILLAGDMSFLSLSPFEVTWRMALSAEGLASAEVAWPPFDEGDLVLYQQGLLSRLSPDRRRELVKKSRARWVEIPPPSPPKGGTGDENAAGPS